jgi:hypothetical protein
MGTGLQWGVWCGSVAITELASVVLSFGQVGLHLLVWSGPPSHGQRSVSTFPTNERCWNRMVTGLQWGVWCGSVAITELASVVLVEGQTLKPRRGCRVGRGLCCCCLGTVLIKFKIDSGYWYLSIDRSSPLGGVPSGSLQMWQPPELWSQLGRLPGGLGFNSCSRYLRGDHVSSPS